MGTGRSSLGLTPVFLMFSLNGLIEQSDGPGLLENQRIAHYFLVLSAIANVR
jgi:hypothetical protein